MKVVITGSSNGIGLATALKFLDLDHEVVGIDKEPYPDKILQHPNKYNYKHLEFDLRDSIYFYPVINNCNVLINNAGVQNSKDDISANLRSVINCTKMYGLNPDIKSILNVASVSAHNGAEFPEYVASKGGVLSYTKWTAKEVAEKYGATCNSLSFGGVFTELNDPVVKNKTLWNQIMDQTPLKRWMTVDECAIWIYFMTMINESCTGQDIIIDNGEMYNHKFIWE